MMPAEARWNSDDGLTLIGHHHPGQKRHWQIDVAARYEWRVPPGAAAALDGQTISPYSTVIRHEEWRIRPKGRVRISDLAELVGRELEQYQHPGERLVYAEFVAKAP